MTSSTSKQPRNTSAFLKALSMPSRSRIENSNSTNSDRQSAPSPFAAVPSRLAIVGGSIGFSYASIRHVNAHTQTRWMQRQPTCEKIHRPSANMRRLFCGDSNNSRMAFRTRAGSLEKRSNGQKPLGRLIKPCCTFRIWCMQYRQVVCFRLELGPACGRGKSPDFGCRTQGQSRCYRQ